MKTFTCSKAIIFTVLIGLVGTLLHFLYGWSGQTAAVGLISAINESVWEHTKIAFIPMMLFWLGLTIHCRRHDQPWPKASVAGIWSTILVVLFIPLFYYYCSQGLGLNSLGLNIANFFLSPFLALLIGAHLYNRTNPSKVLGLIALIGLAVMFILYALWTFMPPAAPMFVSPV